MSDQGRIDPKSGIVTIMVTEEESWFGGGGSKKTTKKVSAIPNDKSKVSVSLINKGFKLNKSEELLMF